MNKLYNIPAPPFLLPLLAVLSMYCLQVVEQHRYRIRTIAFYNLENLFDTTNDSLVYDDDRTPLGKDRWTQQRYSKKVASMARVLSDIGRNTTATTPDLIGLCEVEKRRVLEDLTLSPFLQCHSYGIVHFDSPDERGIDVALLYKQTAFSPTSFKSHRLLLADPDGERDYTRDQLVVGGLLDGEALFIIVNHWPSRSGGQARSEPYRLAAAAQNRLIIDSLRKREPDAKIIIMGDLNDNPTDRSLKKIMKTQADPGSLQEGDIYNPMEMLYKRGAGSLAYRDAWSLFDQILLSANIVNRSQSGYRLWKAGIYNPSYLTTRNGQYGGYPFRTYSGGRYTGGFSDHFPVYLFLIRNDL